MAYVIAEPCIGTKDNSCVEVCPVDCIHPTPDEPDYDQAEQLYIDPEECIDCDACVEACPVDARPDGLGHRQRHADRLRGRRRGGRLHHRQLHGRQRDQSARAVTQRLSGGIIGV